MNLYITSIIFLSKRKKTNKLFNENATLVFGTTIFFIVMNIDSYKVLEYLRNALRKFRDFQYYLQVFIIVVSDVFYYYYFFLEEKQHRAAK